MRLAPRATTTMRLRARLLVSVCPLTSGEKKDNHKRRHTHTYRAHMSSPAKQQRGIAGRRVSESSIHKLQRIKYADSDEASDHKGNGCWIDTVRFTSLLCHLVPLPQPISNLLSLKGTHHGRTFSSKLTCSYHFLCVSKFLCFSKSD